MPIKKLNRPVAKSAPRQHRAARNVRMIQVEAKGHTSEFDALLQKAASAVIMQSNQEPDPTSAYDEGAFGVKMQNAIIPSYPFEYLAKLVQNSNTLRQCIESYVVNIEGLGHTLEYIGEEGGEDRPEVKAEKAELESFLSACAPELSMREVRERSRWDLETVGQRFFEIARDLTGRIVMMDHLPGVTMRRTRRDSEPTEVEIELPNPADPDTMIKKTVMRHFCRFCQYVYGDNNYSKVWFKEFGDPRSINAETGEEDSSLSIEEQATEVLMLSLYTPGQIYGLPRWIGQLPSILGSRESEMVNLNFFRENAIPAMAILISGGALTAESFQVIEDYISSVKGARAMNRMLVLEASGDDTAGSTDHSISAPKIDMKPMISERQQDGLFKEYDSANQQKIRSSFRLPPIYAGRAEDYTRASAFASMVTAEQQIFGPERQAFDDLMNNRILRTYRPRFWRYKSLGVPLADPDSLATMLNTLDSTGALTPNAVIKIANKILDIQIEPITQGWGDYPWSAVMQYVVAGNPVEGLTEFIVDMEALEAQQDAEAERATALISAKQPAPGDPAANDNSNEPASGSKAPPKRLPAKSRSKARSVSKADISANPVWMQQMVRKEFFAAIKELKHHNVQEPAI